MNISYDYYRIFYYVCRYRNFTQAAEALHSNQPNISRAIKLLEHTLGCSLLVRSNRGVSLTPEGELLYRYVRPAVEQLQTAEEELVRTAGLESGSITIGASETALRMVVLPLLQEFKRTYPRIRIRILNHLTVQAVESVKVGSVDFAVVVSPIPADSSLHACPIMRFSDILIGGSSYAAYKRQTLSLKALSAHPLICLGRGTMTYDFYEHFYRRHGLVFEPELEAATTDQILPLVEHNLGIGFLPEIYAADALEKQTVFRLYPEEQLPEREIFLIESRSHPLSTAAQAFKALVLSPRHAGD